MSEPTAEKDSGLIDRVLSEHPGWTQEVDEERTDMDEGRWVYWRFRCSGRTCLALFPVGIGASNAHSAHVAAALIAAGVGGTGGALSGDALELIAQRIEARAPTEQGEPLTNNPFALSVNSYRSGMLEAARIVRESQAVR